MDKTTKLLKEMKGTTETVQPIASAGPAGDFIIPNTSGTRDKLQIGGCFWTADGTSAYLKTDSGTAILTINLTTGNITLGGTQKRVICTKVVGA